MASNEKGLSEIDVNHGLELAQQGGMQRLRDMLLAESTLRYLIEINTQERRSS